MLRLPLSLQARSLLRRCRLCLAPRTLRDTQRKNSRSVRPSCSGDKGALRCLGLRTWSITPYRAQRYVWRSLGYCHAQLRGPASLQAAITRSTLTGRAAIAFVTQTAHRAPSRDGQIGNGRVAFAGSNQATNVASLIQRATLCKAISAPSCIFSV